MLDSRSRSRCWGLGRIAGALVPFVIAFVIVFLLNWPVRALVAREACRGALAVLVCLARRRCWSLGVAVTLLAPLDRRARSCSFAQRSPGYLRAARECATQVAEPSFAAIVVPDVGARRDHSRRRRSSRRSRSASATTLAERRAQRRRRRRHGLLRRLPRARHRVLGAARTCPRSARRSSLLAGPKYEDDAEHAHRHGHRRRSAATCAGRRSRRSSTGDAGGDRARDRRRAVRARARASSRSCFNYVPVHRAVHRPG